MPPAVQRGLLSGVPEGFVAQQAAELQGSARPETAAKEHAALIRSAFRLELSLPLPELDLSQVKGLRAEVCALRAAHPDLLRAHNDARVLAVYGQDYIAAVRAAAPMAPVQSAAVVTCPAAAPPAAKPRRLHSLLRPRSAKRASSQPEPVVKAASPLPPTAATGLPRGRSRRRPSPLASTAAQPSQRASEPELEGLGEASRRSDDGLYAPPASGAERGGASDGGAERAAPSSGQQPRQRPGDGGSGAGMTLPQTLQACASFIRWEAEDSSKAIVSHVASGAVVQDVISAASSSARRISCSASTVGQKVSQSAVSVTAGASTLFESPVTKLSRSASPVCALGCSSPGSPPRGVPTRGSPLRSGPLSSEQAAGLSMLTSMGTVTGMPIMGAYLSAIDSAAPPQHYTPPTARTHTARDVAAALEGARAALEQAEERYPQLVREGGARQWARGTGRTATLSGDGVGAADEASDDHVAKPLTGEREAPWAAGAAQARQVEMPPSAAWTPTLPVSSMREMPRRPTEARDDESEASASEPSLHPCEEPLDSPAASMREGSRSAWTRGSSLG